MPKAEKAARYVVVVAHLAAFDEGDQVTEKQIVDAGGTVAHLLNLGAIRAGNTTQKEG